MSGARAILARLDAARAAAGPAPVPDFCASVRDVVLLASSSRGGSSMFAEMLRGCPGLLHFRGEINALLYQAELTWPESGTGSDRLGADRARGAAARLDRPLALDAGTPDPGPADPELLSLELAWRLAAQWPGLDPDLGLLRRRVEGALAGGDIAGDLQGFHLRLIAGLRADYPRVDPWRYDLDPERIRGAFPGLEPPADGVEAVVEEPPFITIQPWRRADAEALARCPLIIKTPSNAYRLPFWRALFPGARFRVLHLARNAAASINGLMDGWRFRGFHAHRVGPLRIAGYSDTPAGAGGWWKYDLPPAWRTHTRAPLEAVCALQWRSAHRATLDFLAGGGVEHLRLHFEDIVGSPPRRRAAFAALTRWLGLGAEAEAWLLARQVPPVMATARPRARRWYERAALLEPLLSEPAIRGLMAELGYEHDPETWT